MNRTYALASLVTLFALALALPAQGAFPGANGQIAYHSADGSDQEILVTGGGALTSNSWDDRTPAYSPDGKKIAFVSLQDGNQEIYVMDADGGNQVRRTTNPLPDTDPSWSPDGTKIVYSSLQAGNPDIYVMNADGTGTPQRLTEDAGADTDPAWSPDGT